MAADRAANELLREIFHGYPAGKLVDLIHSDNDQAVRSGAWILSELGAEAAQLSDEIAFLLQHSVRNARFFALDAVLTSASEENGPLIAQAVMLIADPDSAVRWKALQFLSDAAPDQLMAARKYLSADQISASVRWLIGDPENPIYQREVLGRLEDHDKMSRMFAAAAAARIANSYQEAIGRASKSDDPDIRDFARDRLAVRK